MKKMYKNQIMSNCQYDRHEVKSFNFGKLFLFLLFVALAYGYLFVPQFRYILSLFGM